MSKEVTKATMVDKVVKHLKGVPINTEGLEFFVRELTSDNKKGYFHPYYYNAGVCLETVPYEDKLLILLRLYNDEDSYSITSDIVTIGTDELSRNEVAKALKKAYLNDDYEICPEAE